jgi:hypothetical protein
MGWRSVQFGNGVISGGCIDMYSGSSIRKTPVNGTTFEFFHRESFSNVIADSIIDRATFQMSNSPDLLESGLLKNPQIEFSACQIRKVKFRYPIVIFDASSLDTIAESIGILFVSIFDLSKEAREVLTVKATNANLSSRLSPFFTLYLEKGNRLLIVNLASDESTRHLRKLLEAVGSNDPATVIHWLTSNRNWLP